MSAQREERHVVVAGGGVTGLAAAHRLIEGSAGSGTPLRVTLLEGSARLGGWIATTRRDGWILEEGPDLFLASKSGAWELCEQLGIADRLHGTSQRARGSYVVHRGQLVRIPEGLTGLVPTRPKPFARTPLLSPLGKLRVAMEPLIPRRRGDSDESVAAFVRRRLGREMYERLVEPLLSGIYAGDGEALSIASTFPHLRDGERTHGSLLRAMRARRGIPTLRGFVSFPTGMAALPEALAQWLHEAGVELRTSTPVAAIERLASGWRVRTADGEELQADAVILALPSRASATLLEPHAGEAAIALREIPLASTATVSLGYSEDDVARPLDATGYLIPRAERRKALACTWSSTKFDERAPVGHALFRVFLGGAAREPIDALPDERLVQLAREEMGETVGVHAEPVLVQVNRQREAMPQYVIGHRERVARIQAALQRAPGLALAGNMLRGVGIPDCVLSGRAAATDTLEGLASFHPRGT